MVLPMSKLVDLITASDREARDRPLDRVCSELDLENLFAECSALDTFRRESDNLYERVRALFFLYAIYRFHLPEKAGNRRHGLISYEGYRRLLNRRFEDAIKIFLNDLKRMGPGDGICSALAAAYHGLGFQTLADQVRHSVRSIRGNRWMFRIGHPVDHPLRVRPELANPPDTTGYPILFEATPVRMDLTHSGWSDIFFLGMDFPEGARVINTSIDLSVRGRDGSPAAQPPRPPVEAYIRVVDRPVLRLTSVDLGASAEITTIPEVFDYAKDYLGLLKAAVIASGIVPPGMEGSAQYLPDLLGRVVAPGYGLEVVSRVNGIPKGSRLAVSTSLLACLVSVCMRATGQTEALTGSLREDERRLVAARAILGEWLAGSGGGWQDSGGLWPGMKLIQGERAARGDPEFGISRGRLLPSHHVFSGDEVSPETRRRLTDSLVLVHGGMAQDVGPILEMVTEKYLLRSEAEWDGRREAIALLNEIVDLLKRGDIRGIGRATHRNFHGPISTIIPWATNRFTEQLIERVQSEFGERFWGFWMLGGMSGGGMGFLFHPDLRKKAVLRMQELLDETKERLKTAVPFAMDPVVYDFAINNRGTWAELLQGDEALMPPGYYTKHVPEMLRCGPRMLSPGQRKELDRFSAACRDDEQLGGLVAVLFDRLLPREEEGGEEETDLQSLLSRHGFDPLLHEQIREDLRNGRLGLAQNRLPVSTRIEDAGHEDVGRIDGGADSPEHRIGMQALANGEVAVVTLAGGLGSRWTKGAGVVKALNPFSKMGGRHRSFVEIHLAKSCRTGRLCGTPLPHVVTTSYLTHQPVADYFEARDNCGYRGPLRLSPGSIIGLRLIPMVRDLRFAWEEMPRQLLDEQAQKVLESLQNALIHWARESGEGNDYTDNLAQQCIHPVGHWYEVPNLFRNGVLHGLFAVRPNLKYLMVHNIDTLGVDVDPALLGSHIAGGATLTTEVITRRIEDRGGGLARVDGQLRLIEGLALPREEVEFTLSYYNTSTTWIDIDQLLTTFGLSRSDLSDEKKVSDAIRELSTRMPTYITLKDVKKRWGNGQEDIFPVTQFEKLWGDMTALPELESRFVEVSRMRGQQLKEPAQLDGWLRDGSAAFVEALCEFSS